MAKARLKNLRAYSKRKGYDQTDFGIPLNHAFSDEEGQDEDEDEEMDEENGVPSEGSEEE